MHVGYRDGRRRRSLQGVDGRVDTGGVLNERQDLGIRGVGVGKDTLSILALYTPCILT